MTRTYSMTQYAEWGPIRWLGPLALRKTTLRRAVLRMRAASRLRRRVVFAYFAWLYQEFNRTGTVPGSMFTADATLEQTAALLDTAGSFSGPEGVHAALRELTDAFDEIQFQPLTAVELARDRLLFFVQFSAAGRGSGLRLDQTVAHVFTVDLESALARRWEVYWREADALQATGLAAPRAPTA